MLLGSSASPMSPSFLLSPREESVWGVALYALICPSFLVGYFLVVPEITACQLQKTGQKFLSLDARHYYTVIKYFYAHLKISRIVFGVSPLRSIYASYCQGAKRNPLTLPRGDTHRRLAMTTLDIFFLLDIPPVNGSDVILRASSLGW